LRSRHRHNLAVRRERSSSKKWYESFATAHELELESQQLDVIERRGHFHTKNNTSKLALSQQVEIVLLAIVGKNKVLQGHFDLVPLLVSQS
jgi:hypothetical protein